MFQIGDRVRVISYQHNVQRMQKFIGEERDVSFVVKNGKRSWYALFGITDYMFREDWLEYCMPEIQKTEFLNILNIHNIQE